MKGVFLKKLNVFSVCLVVLALGLLLASCDDGVPDPLPRLNNIYLVTAADQPNFGRDFSNQRTSFSGGSGLGFIVIGDNYSPYRLGTLYVSFKAGNSLINEQSISMSVNAAGQDGNEYYWFWVANTGYTITQVGTDYSF